MSGYVIRQEGRRWVARFPGRGTALWADTLDGIIVDLRAFCAAIYEDMAGGIIHMGGRAYRILSDDAGDPGADAIVVKGGCFIYVERIRQRAQTRA